MTRIPDNLGNIQQEDKSQINSLLFLVSWNGRENVKEDTVVKHIHLYVKAPFSLNTFTSILSDYLTTSINMPRTTTRNVECSFPLVNRACTSCGFQGI